MPFELTTSEQEQLHQWAAIGAALKTQYDAHYTLTHASADSPLWAPIFALWEAFTAAIARSLGDEGEWLIWFDMENDMGARGFQVTLHGETRAIKSVADLEWVLARDRNCTDDKALLRNALVGLVGAESRAELEQMEVAARLMPAPDADRAASINAIHALLATACC